MDVNEQCQCLASLIIVYSQSMKQLQCSVHYTADALCALEVTTGVGGSAW